MADYIDRDKALAETWRNPSYTNPMNVLTEIRDRLRALPAADVVEHKTGKWTTVEKHHKDDEQEFIYLETRCSECGAIKRIGWRDAVFCPRCGAKMEDKK